MTNRRTISAVISLAVVLVGCSLIVVSEHADRASAQPAFGFARFYGTITVDGVTPEVGTLVRGKIHDRICGLAEVQEIEGFGIGYSVDVKGAVEMQGCAGNGDMVTFDWVDPFPEVIIRECTPTALWDPTHINRVDLSCNAPEPTIEVEVLQGWNFVEWQPDGCKPAGEAFEGLAELGITWRHVASVQGWQSYDPDVPPALNSLTQVCSGDIFIVYTAAAAVWVQS